MGHPGRIRFGSTGRSHHPTGRQVHEEEHIEGVEEHRVDGEGVGRHQALGVRGQELAPAHLRSGHFQEHLPDQMLVGWIPVGVQQAHRHDFKAGGQDPFLHLPAQPPWHQRLGHPR